ncbi:hypothetical protein JR316_0003942 [Psilocybe cubensis]|uniref:gamma-glutamylcyclotransferase n=2 Tax=Psilocybe cubensis TaxID=181762 RepID=A0A8H8CNJ9_PSICU|nr:hypothetical protein JR316_0003942 [Psilocybe cubensis]KAH9484460.1 hypothetical protein JR316_0003942 [Psilocybe cubensis]
MSSKTVYFGYGSNLWLDQMKRRCPESKYVGVGSLKNWKWIINERGYGNIIPSAGDIVYGLMYELTARDEHDLDLYEGETYQKQIIPVDFTGTRDNPTKEVVRALVYIDVERKGASSPRKEYIYRMNMGIADALKEGIPAEYIDKYLRLFIPPPDARALEFSDS